MIQITAIAIGGATGAVLRFWVSTGVYSLLGRGFPYGTFTVNVVGSLLMGLLFVILQDRLSVSVEWRAFLLIGVLGSFTTFSTFSIETFNLFEDGENIKAVMNMLLSVLTCVAATWIGVMAGRQL